MTGDEPETQGTRRLPTIERDASPGAGDGGEGGSGLRQSASAAAYESGDEPRSARRFWSTRRVPATIVAALVVAGVGLVLYDVAAVRAGRNAMAWRRRLAEELAERPLDDAWMIGGAAGAMVIGLWLLVLALTPGLRSLLPMRRPVDAEGAEHVRAGLHRSAAAMVLRDRAMEVPGVHAARVKVRRRKVGVRAQAHFRDLDEVRGDLDAALAAGLRELGLARRPALSVHVRRPSKR
ncbi:DUF6286 domain-containing protein [Streptomyces sp. 8N706]|uniref:DUF6286 domain-containing protein n=1 Tax=Streptomyces sp. 8N706 TaxID=3457416 RepID=UPI003FD4EB11